MPAGARHLPADTTYPELQAVQTPEPSQAEQKDDVPVAQQVLWQSPDEHWSLDAHEEPALSSVQSPATTEYGVLHAVQAPDASHVLQCAVLPAEQHLLWQSDDAHSALAPQSVPAGARHVPALSV